MSGQMELISEWRVAIPIRIYWMERWTGHLGGSSSRPSSFCWYLDDDRGYVIYIELEFPVCHFSRHGNNAMAHNKATAALSISYHVVMKVHLYIHGT